MGIFSLTQEIAVDLGTANTIIIHNDKIVVDEPSYVALDSKGKLVAVGEKAKMMQGKEHPGIRTIRPLRDGVIADFNAAELMIRGLIKMVSSKHIGSLRRCASWCVSLRAAPRLKSVQSATRASMPAAATFI